LVEVERVIDGDTIEVVLKGIKTRVRLHGIDAPEHNQPGGRYAASYLRAQLAKPVYIKVMNTDLHGTIVARLVAGKLQEDVSRRMVCDGAAWLDRRHVSREDALRLCEERARDARDGTRSKGGPTGTSEW